MKRGVLARLFGRGQGEFEAARPWQASVAQPTIAPQAIVRPPLQHDPVMTRHVRLPLVQALICGFFAALVPTGIVVVIIIVAKAGGWWWATIPATFVISGLALSGIAWYVLFVMNTKTLLLIERFVGVDLNRDGAIGKLPPKSDRFLVDWIDQENEQIDHHQWPIPQPQVQEIGEAHQRGVNLSKRELARHTSLSEEKALEVLAYMRSKAYAHYVDGNKTELTGRGEYFFKRLLSS